MQTTTPIDHAHKLKTEQHKLISVGPLRGLHRTRPGPRVPQRRQTRAPTS